MFSKLLGSCQKNIEYCFFILSIVIVSFPLILYNLPATHDGYWHLNWSYHWNQQVLSGQFYPRWFEDAFGGLGTPTFSFYPPLFRSLSFPFAFLGFSATQQIICSIIIVFIINGLGSLKYANLIFKNKDKTFICISVLLATFNPYLIINTFIRGAWAEALAMSLIPWILFGTKLSIQSNHKLKELPLIIAFSILAISHLPSLLMVTFVYLCYLFFLITESFNTIKKYIRNVYLPIGLSFCLTSFYLVPAYFNRVSTIIYLHTPKVQHYHNLNLRFLINNILNLTPNFASDPFDRSLVNVFLLSALVLTITIALLAINWHVIRFIISVQDLKFILFLSFISLLMNTDLSKPIYFFIPILRSIQFPWRFLSICTTLLPFIFAIALFILSQIIRKKYQIFIRVLTIFLIVLVMSKSTNFSSIKFNPEIMKKVDIYLSKDVIYENIDIENSNKKIFQKLVSGENNIWGIFINNKKEIITVDVKDYFYSKCFNPDYWDKYNFDWVSLPKQNYPLIEWKKGSGKISNLKWDLGLREFNVKTETVSILNLKTLYYPGWNIAINSPYLSNNSSKKSAHSCTPDGRISLNLPPGEFNILVSYEGTKYDNIGLRVSIISLISTMIYFLFQFSNFLLFPQNKN